MAERYEDVDVGAVRKGISRRNFLQRAAFSTAAGALTGIGTDRAARYVAKAASELVAYFEKNMRTIAVNLEEATGVLEKRVASGQSDLKEAYKHPDLKAYQELDLATQEDISGLGRIVENCDEQIDHYDFVENLNIAYDRFRNQLLDVGSDLYSVQDWEGRRKVDQGIGMWIQKEAARLTGTKLPEDQESRMNLAIAAKKRLEELCATYNANSDLRRAIPPTIEKLNQYLTDSQLSGPEREFYSSMKTEFQSGNHTETLAEFMKNHENFGQEAESFLTNKKADYEQVKKSKEHVLALQEKLRKGILIKQELREQTNESFAAYYDQFRTRVDSHVNEVDQSVEELKAMSYDIKTRADEINQDTLRRNFDRAMDSVIKYSGLVVGTLAALGAYRLSGSRNRARIEKRVTDHVAKEANERGRAYNALQEQNLNTSSPSYENGEGI